MDSAPFSLPAFRPPTAGVVKPGLAATAERVSDLHFSDGVTKLPSPSIHP